MHPFALKRLGLLMEPEPGNPLEVEGVLNPAATRGPDGQLYLFPRLVGKGNFSRIGIARVLFDDQGDPKGVQRLGVALAPEAEYELRPDGTGGCEDPRVTYVEATKRYVMTYTAWSAEGPRVALAVSEDLMKWDRLGLVTFEPCEGLEFNGVDNKDACVFPSAVQGPTGKLSLALLHRPLFPGTRPEEKVESEAPHWTDFERESIWISFRDLNLEVSSDDNRCHFTSHQRLAMPQAAWEKLKIGSGAPPVLTPEGWLLVYHGVHEMEFSRKHHRGFCYSAGAMVLDKTDPSKILYRSPEPILTPRLPEEKIGIVGDVVFPTGIDRRDDIGRPDRYDVYYGMADDRIGVATLHLPPELPS